MPYRIAILALAIIVHPDLDAQTCDIYGVVTDSLTRQRIPSANIMVLGTTRGAASNNVGFYIIPKLSPGTYEVIASVMGYSRVTKRVTLRDGRSIELNFELQATAIEEREVVVSASRKPAHTETSVSVHVLDQQDLKTIPVAAQQDLLQALKILPGIVSTSDVSSRFYVRGGAGDQNLFLFNGTRIYYPFHALGIYSVFNPNIVDNVEVYTGAFPPGYGGRLSSVVNISTRDGRADRISAKTNVNFLSGEALLEGPAFENSSWIMNVRRSLSSQTFSTIVGQHIPISFYDGSLKISLQPGGVRKFDLTFLSSGDNLLSSSPDDPDYHWKNNAFSLAGSYLPTDRVFVQWLIYGSVYSADRNAKSSTAINSQATSVRHYGLRSTATVYAGPRDQYDFGFEFSFPSLNFSFINRLGIPAELQSSFIDVSAWARYQAQYERTHLDLGLHAELAPLLEGEGVFYELQPRFGLSHELNGGWTAKLSYGRFTQRMLTVGNEDDVISIFEGWIRVPSNVPAQRADHFVTGLSGSIAPLTSLNAEAYYKSYGSLVVYNWNKGNVADPDYVQGTGDSYGLEFMVRSKYSWIDFYGAYSLSWAWIKNQGLTYSPRYDRRHHINLMAVARPIKGMSATLKWEFGSGFPYSQSAGYIERPSLDNSLPGRFEYGQVTCAMLLGPKNTSRLPAYHRLDASLAYSASLFGLECSLGIDMLNVYDNKNIFYFDRLTGERINMLPIYPSVALAVKY